MSNRRFCFAAGTLLAFGVVLGVPAVSRADIKTVAVVTAKGLPANAENASFYAQPVTVTTYYKGDKSRSESPAGVTMTDYHNATDRL